MDFRTIELQAYLRAVASKGAPGGGSVAAVAGATAAAVVNMVAQLTVDVAASEGEAAEARRAEAAAQALTQELTDLATEDHVALSELLAAWRMPRGTDEERGRRQAAIAASAVGASRAPLRIAGSCRKVLELAHALARFGNRRAISDIGVAIHLAEASLRSAALNVDINLRYLAPDDRTRVVEELRVTCEGTDELAQDAIAQMRAKM